MRKLSVALLLLLVGQTAYAEQELDCPKGTFLRPIGVVSTGNDTGGADGGAHQVSEAGHIIRASRVSCAGTACVAGVYDADPTNEVGTAIVDADVVDEPGAAANTSTWTEYDPPLNIRDGLVFRDDSNVNAFIAFECRP